MNQNDEQRFFEIMSGLAEIYDKKLSEMALSIYFNALHNYPIDKIRKAANSIVMQKTFNKFPLPAEFVEYIDPSGNLEAQAMIAVEEVLDKNEIQGGTMSVSFTDPLIHHTIIRMGGWVKVAAKIREIAFDNPKEMPFWKKDFMKLYCYFAKQSHLDPPPKYLTGSMAADNINAGYFDPDTGTLKLSTGEVRQIETNKPQNMIGE